MYEDKMKDKTLDGKFNLVILRLFIKFCTILHEWGMNFIRNHMDIILYMNGE